MEIIKIGAIGMIGVLLALQFKTVKAEYSMYIVFLVGILIFFTSIHYIDYFLGEISGLKILLKDNSSNLKIILKVIGITYICEFCAGVCSDAGYKSVANQIEIFGKIFILIIGMPIILSLIQLMEGFMEK